MDVAHFVTVQDFQNHTRSDAISAVERVSCWVTSRHYMTCFAKQMVEGGTKIITG